MTSQTLPVRPLATFDGERLVRNSLFLATLLLCWFTVSPFPDLGDPRLLEPKLSGDLLSQAAALLLTGALAAFVLLKRPALLKRAVTLPLVVTFAAFTLSALLSAYPAMAERRIALAVFTIFQASVLLLLPYGREHFARLLTLTAIIVLVACYFGVAFAPQRSIHQITDVTEPALAGDWRGFFTHKNGAGAGMALLIFVGIFVYRAWNRLAGILIAVFAFIFLYFTEAKSPLNLLPVVLLLSYCIPRLRSSLAVLVLVLAVPIAINVLTIGSVMFGSVREALGQLMSDPTYTGRDEIWRFALAHVAERPLFGFGFEAFWGTPELLNAWNPHESWGYRASDAHNGYLNLLITTGFVGLAAALWWIIVQPLGDLRRAFARPADRPLATLFLQIWLLGLCLSGFESEFFRGGSELWFLTATSIVGLRFLTMTQSSG